MTAPIPCVKSIEKLLRPRANGMDPALTERWNLER